MRIGILILLLTFGVGVFALSSVSFKGDEKVLRVTFFDVGQGDSLLIESPTGMQVLIDGGPDSILLKRLGEELGFFDRTIDVVLATHPDKDHTGGLPDVLERYKVDTVILTENEGESSDADAFRLYAQKENAQIVYARTGMLLDLGGGTQLEILFPERDPSMLESNTSSIVARLTYGESEFLLTGDSPEGIENHLVSLYGKTLDSDVLKVGHHGSRTSTSEAFVKAVDPEYAVISSGRDNRYGHPHKEVTDLLSTFGVDILNTAEVGTIIFKTDGKNLERVD